VSVVAPRDTAGDRTTALPSGKAALPAELAAPKPPAPALSRFGSIPEFPIQWPDEAASKLHWKRQGSGTPSRPLELDVSLARRRTRANASAITGGETSERVVAFNGQVYAAQVPSPFTAIDRSARKASYEQVAGALVAQGETYLERVIFPELDETNARLGAVDVFTVPAETLASHLEETLRWYERAWTLHWLRPADDPRERFIKLYQSLTGDMRRESASELFSHAPNVMTEAIDGVIELARLAQRHVPLRMLLLSASSEEALAALETVEGGADFRQALDQLIKDHGLRCGEGAGNERVQMAPSWREDPGLVIALVRNYVTLDLDKLDAARAATLRRRDARVDALRATIEDSARRAEFDFWLGAARRALQRFEDHNYKIDSAAAALLRLAIVAAAKRLAAAGWLDDPEDIWWLRAAEISLSLRGLAKAEVRQANDTAETGDASVTGGTGSVSPTSLGDDPAAHWKLLVPARMALHEWRKRLIAPETLGAPAPAEGEPSGRGPGGPGGHAASTQSVRPPPPENVLVVGETGSMGIAAGRVRLVDRNALVPEATPGDVLVARNASPLWAPLFPVVAAVVLDAGGFVQHAMLTCREYGTPAVFQTKDATQRLTDGQRVIVDATNGWVLPADE
jgi:phosphohistidine swiveling domain-containing protein